MVKRKGSITLTNGNYYIFVEYKDILYYKIDEIPVIEIRLKYKRISKFKLHIFIVDMIKCSSINFANP